MLEYLKIQMKYGVLLKVVAGFSVHTNGLLSRLKREKFLLEKLQKSNGVPLRKYIPYCDQLELTQLNQMVRLLQLEKLSSTPNLILAMIE